MPDEDNKILKYIPGEKSLKVPFIIYDDTFMLTMKRKKWKRDLWKSKNMLYMWKRI